MECLALQDISTHRLLENICSTFNLDLQKNDDGGYYWHLSVNKRVISQG